VTVLFENDEVTEVRSLIYCDNLQIIKKVRVWSVKKVCVCGYDNNVNVRKSAVVIL